MDVSLCSRNPLEQWVKAYISQLPNEDNITKLVAKLLYDMKIYIRINLATWLRWENSRYYTKANFDP